MLNKLTGDYGEGLACNYLKKVGYKIVERNYRIKGGEIDIVAKDRGVLVFVEVKTRYSHDFGSPLESMTPWKVKALLRTAQFYVLKTGWGDKEYRLDFVSVDFSDDPQNAKIELIQNIASYS